MNFKLFGLSLNLVNLLSALSVVYFIVVVAGCSCSKLSFREGMSALGYKMGQGVQTPGGAYDVRAQQAGSSLSYRAQQHDTYQGTKVPLPEGQLYMFAGNEFKPSCCGSTYTNSSGCMCATKQQIDYVNQRGGNHSCDAGEF